MFVLDEFYEPDEILRDVDVEADDRQQDELSELNFENERDAAEGYTFLIEEVESPQELIVVG